MDLCWWFATRHASQPRPGLCIASLALSHCMTRIARPHAFGLESQLLYERRMTLRPLQLPCQSISIFTPCTQSCLAIADSVSGSQASGNYWVGVGAGATRVYCDMLSRTVAGNGSSASNSGVGLSVCLRACQPVWLLFCSSLRSKSVSSFVPSRVVLFLLRCFLAPSCQAIMDIYPTIAKDGVFWVTGKKIYCSFDKARNLGTLAHLLRPLAWRTH